MVRSRWVGLIRGGMMDRDLVIDWGRVDYGGGVVRHLWGVDWGGVVHWLHGAVGRGGGGVAVYSSVLDRGGVVDGVVDWAGSISFSFCMD